MNQNSGTTPADGAVQAQGESRLPAGEDPAQAPGFASRGRIRRRARFLRKARELAYRDLGGLVFSLHRYGQRNDELVLAKLGTIADIDAQLRALEGTLGEATRITVLREGGITACARCAAIHSSEDRFCPNCGLAMGPHAEVPIAAAAPATARAVAPSPPEAPAPQAPTSASALTRSFEQPSATAPAAGAPPVPARTGRQGPPEPAPREAASAASPAGPGNAAERGTEVPAGAEEPTEILRPPAGT